MGEKCLAVTSIVLAGGKSSRLGWDKTWTTIAGESLLQRVVACIAPLSTEIIVVTSPNQATPSFLPQLRVKKVVDLYPGKGSLGGIYSGLAAASRFHSLVVACDMPFLNVGLIGYMLELCPSFDVVIPRVRGMTEPLHAVYSKNCLTPIKEMLQQGNLRIIDFFDAVKVRYVEETEIDPLDPEHLSFFNINTKADLKRARMLVKNAIG